jgi:molecular chaperone GrpE
LKTCTELVHIAGASHSIVDGVHLIRQQFNEVLQSNGVTAFDREGQAFDPMAHEAISVIDIDDEGQSGNVFAEERGGYLMNGQLLRPARVAVLKVKRTE